jgi:hypothetical protein
MEEVKNHFIVEHIGGVNTIDDANKIINAKVIVIKLVIINLLISAILYSIYLIF